METKLVTFTAADVAKALPSELYLHIKDRVTLPTQFFVVEVLKGQNVADLAWSVKQYSANGTLIYLHDVLTTEKTVKIVVRPNTRFGQAGLAYTVLAGLNLLSAAQYTLVNAFERADDQGGWFKGLNPVAEVVNTPEVTPSPIDAPANTTQGDGGVSEAIWNTERLIKTAVLATAALLGLYLIYRMTSK